MDKEANANGGMLVIATSVPDEREWIQWRGRTARQDRPGQFHVVLSRQAPPLVERAGLAEQLLGMASHEQRLSRLLEIADESIGATLKRYELDQELGEMVNELTEAFFQRYPRSFDEPWPSEEHGEQDKRLRALFEQIQAKKGCTVKDFQRMAKEKLDIELEGGDTGFTLASLFQKKRQGEMNAQVGA